MRLAGLFATSGSVGRSQGTSEGDVAKCRQYRDGHLSELYKVDDLYTPQ